MPPSTSSTSKYMPSAGEVPRRGTRQSGLDYLVSTAAYSADTVSQLIQGATARKLLSGPGKGPSRQQTLLREPREQSAAISVESKRAELQLSKFARQIATQNGAYSASAAKLEAASNPLAAALRHALIPKILSFVFQPR